MYAVKNYEHVKCKCGGIIGMYDRESFTCERCGDTFLLYNLDYDVCWTNGKTGWIFPIRYKYEQDKSDEHVSK